MFCIACFVGIWHKQSSFFFSAKSCDNIIAYNVLFNAPKATIEFNDGFGGNNRVYKNLLFNNVRENVGHGPINSWDRNLYLWNVNNSEMVVTKRTDLIYQNFVLANYGSMWAIDNDDGSNNFHSYNNFLIYANDGLKSNAGGYNNVHNNNIYAYNQQYCWNIHTAPDQNHLNYYYNNTCIVDQNVSQITNETMYKYIYNEYCNQYNPSQIGIRTFNNSIYIAGANEYNIGMCGNITEEQLKTVWGLENDTNVYGYWPNDESIIALARSLIFD